MEYLCCGLVGYFNPVNKIFGQQLCFEVLEAYLLCIWCSEMAHYHCYKEHTRSEQEIARRLAELIRDVLKVRNFVKLLVSLACALKVSVEMACGLQQNTVELCSKSTDTFCPLAVCSSLLAFRIEFLESCTCRRRHKSGAR